jgi:DNA-binding transcriptional ArsR family regulator
VLNNQALDQVFHALADPTRRAIVERLVRGSASVSDLAAPFDVSLSAIVQHINLLEDHGLVRTTKAGRTRTVELERKRLDAAEHWFAKHRERWEQRFDRLGALLADDAADTADNTEPHRKQRK